MRIGGKKIEMEKRKELFVSRAIVLVVVPSRSLLTLFQLCCYERELYAWFDETFDLCLREQWRVLLSRPSNLSRLSEISSIRPFLPARAVAQAMSSSFEREHVSLRAIVLVVVPSRSLLTLFQLCCYERELYAWFDETFDLCLREQWRVLLSRPSNLSRLSEISSIRPFLPARAVAQAMSSSFEREHVSLRVVLQWSGHNSMALVSGSSWWCPIYIIWRLETH
ncbi:hypothetical protein DEO72_LG2g3243 [Vigna unguiculata]|uniref:Uncharacterized protein n=1 Tax=Vigna unguiculata TaxID=3917 RepID=A0A4D6L313_VIGUN|nr:hypothetical protein DEO72_LG2g3243 [Vigna unguiculata]